MTRIAVVYNAPAVRPIGQDPSVVRAVEGQGEAQPDAQPDASELGVVAQVAAVCAILETRGDQAPAFAVRDVSALVDWLVRERPDAVFNCCESLGGRADLEMCLAGLFELLAVPYTGSTPITLGLCVNKGLAKAVLQAHGVGTPGYTVVDSVGALEGATALSWPLIVKPLAEDASIGIDEGAVVHDVDALRARVAFLTQDLGGPVMVEEFIDGREFMVALLATSPREWTALPIEEVSFACYPPAHPRILTYAAKWLPQSEAYRASVVSWPTLSPEVASRLHEAAIAAARAVGVRDYGRVDLRMRADGTAFVLEVNPNPDIGPESGFIATARVAGLSYEDVVTTIARRALERRNAAAVKT
jgi:D-alanine-D-alanine ligase